MKELYSCYSRLLIDSHITDQKAEFMSRFSSEKYVEMVGLSSVESAMIYSCDHNGNCYYPTRCGHLHGGLRGRDVFGEIVAGLRKKNILPIAYYTVIYHNDSANRLPSARIRDINGNDHNGRYHYCCPNQPEALAFYEKQIAEVLAYDIGGIFIDMTFWPMICRCSACREKFRETCHAEMPEIIDWNSPDWVRFQRFREKSMAEFAQTISGFVRKTKPGIPVTHQFSPVLHGWYLGQSSGIAAACDYTSGDFYGGKLQQRLAVKVFDAYTEKRPFEFMTSRCVSLRDHTSTRSDDDLYLHELTTLANGGAFFFIDAINPDGSLERPFYERLGKIVEKLKPFRQKIEEHRPVLRAEVGLYFSMSSFVDEKRNGLNLRSLDEKRANMDYRENAVLDEVLGTARILNELHIPFRVLTDVSTDFSGFKTIVLNNAAYLSPEECSRLRAFVRDGGTLIATGRSSLFDRDGNSTGNFALAELFGADYSGRRTGYMHYLSFENELVSAYDSAPLVTVSPDRIFLASDKI